VLDTRGALLAVIFNSLLQAMIFISVQRAQLGVDCPQRGDRGQAARCSKVVFLLETSLVLQSMR
jgi:hypothetical protein